jgi:glutamate/tyrosine decarboxylase-like PLP-dependent enzyme
MASNEQSFERNDDNNSQNERDSVESESYIDQTDLNFLVQKWLDALTVLHREPVESKPHLTPKSIPLEAQDLQKILGSLKHLIQPLQVPPHSACRAGGTHIAILARSLAAYLQVALRPKDVEQLLQKITEQTTTWISTLFRFDPSNVASLYHDSMLDGCRKVVQIALHRNCERLLEDGYPTLYTNPPVVYVGATGPVECFQKVIVQLGLPSSTLRIVPCNTVFGSSHAMDVAALEQLLVEDKSEGKMPLLVVGSAGTYVAGHIDSISRLKELSDQHNMWLHIQGDILSSLCLQDEAPELSMVKMADSVCLKPGLWFGMLSVPYVTLYRKILFPVPKPPEVKDSDPNAGEDGKSEPDPVPKSTKPSRLFISPQFWAAIQPDGVDKLLPLVLWVAMQYLGERNLVDTVTYSQTLTQEFLNQLAKIDGLKRVCLSSHWSPVVLFKYCGGGQIAPPPIYSKKATNSEPQSDKGEEEESVPQDSAKMSEKAIDVAELPQQTADGFTQSIIKMIPHIASKVGITLVSIPKVGICCRFNAIEAFPEQGISVEDVIGFCKSLETAVRSVHTLALSRVVFQKGVASHPRLRYLEFPASLSVGFIQCLPEAIANKSELTMDEVNSVNRLNYDLSRNLSHRNQEAFACYQHGNFSCVQLKSVPPGTTIHELMEILYEVVDEMESGRKNMEDMSSLVMKGIKEAEKELEEQKLKKLEEEVHLCAVL